MAEEARQALVITVSADHRIHEVAGELRVAGLDIDQVLEAIHVVTGSAHPRSVEQLRGVGGVTDVSPDHPVDIGGSPVS